MKVHFLETFHWNFAQISVFLDTILPNAFLSNPKDTVTSSKTLQTDERRKFEEEQGKVRTSAFDKQRGLPLGGGVPLRGMAALNFAPCPLP